MLSSTRAEDRLSKVAIAVVNWNDVASSLRCVASIKQASPDTMVILVDNGSDEDPTAAVNVESPGTFVVRLNRNLGYAGGCNAGAAAAVEQGAEFLFFLNNDTTIDAGTLPALIQSADEHPASILAPKIVYSDRPDILWSAGGTVTGPLLRNEHIGEDEPAIGHKVSRRVDWASGCALFLTAESFKRIGPMDEDYFLYLEDVDWCLRGSRLGIETWFVPNAVVRHEVSRTLRAPEWSDQVRYYAYRNRYRLAFRFGSLASRPFVIAEALWTLTKAGIRSATSSDHRGNRHYHMRTRAVVDFFKGRWGAFSAPQARRGSRPRVEVGK